MKFNLLIIILLNSFVSLSQITESKGSHLIGVNLSTISGTGVSYRFNYNKFSTQLTAFGYKKTVRLKFNTGVSFLYTFRSTESSEFLIGMSGKLKYLKDERFVYHDPDLILKKQNNRQINIGIHLDYFNHFSEKIGMNLSFGYGLYNMKGVISDFNHNFILKVYNPFTFITGGIGLYYRI